jgi:hypothetical protein
VAFALFASDEQYVPISTRNRTTSADRDVQLSSLRWTGSKNSGAAVANAYSE